MKNTAKRWSTATLYLAGLALLGVVAYGLAGWIGAAAYAGAVLLALGGLRSLGLILWMGIAKYPPGDWFGGKTLDDEK